MLVGETIKAIRAKKGYTLRQVAERTGLSVGFLSNVERDINSPTISSLAKIAQALDTSLVDLFESTNAKESMVVRKAERKNLFASEPSRTTYDLLSPRNRRLQAILITIEPGGDYGEIAYGHPGDEFGLVIAGALEITAGEESHVLASGDSIYIEALVPHKYRNHGQERCVSVWVRSQRDE